MILLTTMVNIEIRELISSSKEFLHIISPTLNVIRVRNFFNLLEDLKHRNVDIKLFISRLSVTEKVLIKELDFPFFQLKGISSLTFINEERAITWQSEMDDKGGETNGFVKVNRGVEYENLCLELFKTLNRKFN